MSAIYRSICELIGNTPLMEPEKLEKKYGLPARLLLKLEARNPAGSAKDRVALAMIRRAEEEGLLHPGSLIVEPTSGNTGIGLCAVAARLGYRVAIVMPDSMSVERRRLMTAYGAELVLTPGAAGMAGAIARAEEIAAENPGSFLPGQFVNPANPEAHYTTTGPEIYRDTDGAVDVFVAGVGTGGTLMGVGRYLKEKNPDVRLVAVEPAASAVLSGKPAGRHGIQGIGAGFVPEVMDPSLPDEIFPVEDEDACRAARLLAREEGILAGISGGAALHAALSVAARKEYRGKTVVALLPDTGERYVSSLYAE